MLKHAVFLIDDFDGCAVRYNDSHRVPVRNRQALKRGPACPQATVRLSDYPFYGKGRIVAAGG